MQGRRPWQTHSGMGRKLPCKFRPLCRECSGEANGPFGKVTGRSDAPHLKRSDCDAADSARLVSRPQRFPPGSSELADPTVIEYIKILCDSGILGPARLTRVCPALCSSVIFRLCLVHYYYVRLFTASTFVNCAVLTPNCLVFSSFHRRPHFHAQKPSAFDKTQLATVCIFKPLPFISTWRFRWRFPDGESQDPESNGGSILAIKQFQTF